MGAPNRGALLTPWPAVFRGRDRERSSSILSPTQGSRETPVRDWDEKVVNSAPNGCAPIPCRRFSTSVFPVSESPWLCGSDLLLRHGGRSLMDLSVNGYGERIVLGDSLLDIGYSSSCCALVQHLWVMGRATRIAGGCGRCERGDGGSDGTRTRNNQIDSL